MDLKSTLNPLSVAASLGCVIMTSAQPVRADVIVIPELQAATLFGASAANNNSSSGPGIFVGSDGAGNPKRGLIEFNIAGSLPSDATIEFSSRSGSWFRGSQPGRSDAADYPPFQRHNQLGGRHQRGDYSQPAGQLP